MSIFSGIRSLVYPISFPRSGVGMRTGLAVQPRCCPIPAVVCIPTQERGNEEQLDGLHREFARFSGKARLAA